MTRKILPYNPKLVPLAKKLRQNSTLSEVLLWNRLKNNQLDFDFHRQKPIGNYIVDFYCPDLLFAIEIDGNSHHFKNKEDLERQEELEEMGVIFLRFTDLEVKREIDQVVEDIAWMLEELSETDFSNPPRG